ncbi:hypothetical protein IFM89_037568 [Coptis chinensis]|uniref:Uncharacterized protein n=1 Tax=Coptis chinensis TaxID=261450 RepID=A0A835HVC6_9MAGN|nr:hypothetical protein IFM89_037568 [Coptis chinensis]
MWEPTEGRPIDIVVAETGWPSAELRQFYPSMEPVYPLCDTVGLDMKWEARNVPTSPGRLHRLCEYICAKLLTIYSRVFFLLFLIISNFMQVSFAH